jgi:hypothetical protein
MSRTFLDNIKKGKFHLALILGLTAANSYYFANVSLKNYVFGEDGIIL